MPRPKKYHTADERREAKAACMRRSHHARKDAVNERRRELYASKTRRQRKVNRQKQRELKVGCASNERSRTATGCSKVQRQTEEEIQETQRRETVRTSLAKVQSVRTAVGHTLQGSAKSYLDTRCAWFEVDLKNMPPRGPVEVIGAHLEKWNGFLERLKPCMSVVLNLAGYGDEFKSIEELHWRVEKIIQWLEDILCVALVDPLDVVQTYKKGELLYQDEMKDNGEM